MLRDNHFQLYIPVRRVWELQAEKVTLVSSKSRQWKSMLPTVLVLNHHPTHKASRRIAMWPVMERWWGRQCHFSVVPARCKLTLLLSSLMEEKAFTRLQATSRGDTDTFFWHTMWFLQAPGSESSAIALGIQQLPLGLSLQELHLHKVSQLRISGCC